MFVFVALKVTALVAYASMCDAFQIQQIKRSMVAPLRASEDKISEIADTITELDKFLGENYPLFHNVVKANEDIYQALKDTKKDVPRGGFTVFAPNADAFANLGEKKNSQLADPRNLEILEKTGAYHFVSIEAVSAERLRREDWTRPKTSEGKPALKVGGIMTLAGEIPIGRSKSGGFMGWFAKEDGGIVIGTDNAKIIQSHTVGNCIVHEVDALVSPVILWRYFDQLRIPGF